MLTKGNSKLHKSIGCWSITPVLSCPNCKQCAKTCYAMKSYRRYPSVQKAWDRNFESTMDADRFYGEMYKELEKGKFKVVRIHVSGDFHSQAYVNTWEKLCRKFPEIQFYGYSKAFGVFNLDGLASLPNVNIINSMAPDGGVNYGDALRVVELKNMGYKVCPATDKANHKLDIVCGKDCKLCQTTEKVCFFIH